MRPQRREVSSTETEGISPGDCWRERFISWG